MLVPLRTCDGTAEYRLGVCWCAGRAPIANSNAPLRRPSARSQAPAGHFGSNRLTAGGCDVNRESQGHWRGPREVLVDRDEAFRSGRCRKRRIPLATTRKGGKPDMQANRLAPHMAGVAVIVLGLLAAACNSTQAAQNASNKQAQSSAPATNTAAHTAETTGYNPHIDPANFVKKIDNPLFPLKPGTKNELQSRTSDGVGHETLTVTHDTKKIAGVTTTVIKDVSTLDGRLEEKTTDWYAQDKQGNVWYFGEHTATYKK